MSILISSTERVSFVSGIRDHFETFASTHTLTVVKEPQQTVVDINTNEYNAYGYQNSPSNYNFVQESGVWNCMTYSPESWDDNDFDPIPNTLTKGDLIIKVETPASNYIDNGKNNRVIVDSQTYNIVGGPLMKSYITQAYFYYSLERTT